MDGELGAALEGILSDPAQMEKLSHMAKELFGQAGESADGETQTAAAQNAPAPRQDAPAAPTMDTKLLSALGRAFAGNREPSRSTALLMAMRPYMKPEKQEKLDRAMKIARMAGIAGVVMREYGGGEHGV